MWIFFGSVGLVVLLVAIVLDHRKDKDFCSEGVWATFWLSIAILGGGVAISISYIPKVPPNPYNWKYLCVKNKGKIKTVPYEKGSYYYDYETCDYGQDNKSTKTSK